MGTLPPKKLGDEWALARVTSALSRNTRGGLQISPSSAPNHGSWLICGGRSHVERGELTIKPRLGPP